MTEKQMNQVMMISAMVTSIISGLAGVGLLIATVTQSMALILPTLLLGGICTGTGWATAYYGRRLTGEKKVFSNEAEREVLTKRQRDELRRARGEVVMQRALNEIEDEKDKMLAKQLEGPKDDEEVIKPEPLKEEPEWNQSQGGYQPRDKYYS
jgi:hypothetical protein